jgi:hypothetical protein
MRVRRELVEPGGIEPPAAKLISFSVMAAMLTSGLTFETGAR